VSSKGHRAERITENNADGFQLSSLPRWIIAVSRHLLGCRRMQKAVDAKGRH
jgi:hypothetical protein